MQIMTLVKEFNKNNEISESDFNELLAAGKLRQSYVDYAKHYHHMLFSRYLLAKGTEYRKAGKAIGCEDLLAFAYFVGKNRAEKDLELIIAAKITDFDTWCGFDGEMVFKPLGRKKTVEYLKLNQSRLQLSKEQVDYFENYQQIYIDEYEETEPWFL